MTAISFFGLGTMGLPMAINLVKAGHDVTGFDIAVEPRVKLERAGGIVASDAETAAGFGDVIITMLPDGANVRAVFEQSIFAGAPRGALLIDCSTIDVETTRDLAEKAAEKGFAMVDAPVSGGAEGAAVGKLSFMVGGANDAVKRALDYLEVMGSKIVNFGSPGSGQAAKACHNMICGITALGVCEAFALAEGLGLDSGQFFELCKGAAAQSWILENRCPVPGLAPNAPSSNEYKPGFTAALMAKDLRLAQAAAKTLGMDTPFGADAACRFTEFASTGGGDLDFSAIYRAIRPS